MLLIFSLCVYLLLLFFLMFYFLFLLSTTDHIKRKIRRRPSWGRGIIRKKKSYKKGTEEEEEEEPEPEVEATGPSDSCLTQDEESSCDTTGPQPNGHHPHLPSTEEESSNEPPVSVALTSGACDVSEEPTLMEGNLTAKEAEKQEKHTELQSPREEPKVEEKMEKMEAAQVGADVQPSKSSGAECSSSGGGGGLLESHCVNGNDSMDSLDSQSLDKSSEADKRTQSPDSSNSADQEEEHKDKSESKSTQENPPQEERTENVTEDQEKEGRKFAVIH